MLPPRTLWLFTVLPLLVASPVRRAEPEQGNPQRVVPGTRFVFHQSPVIELYFQVRAPGEQPEALAPAVEAAKALDRALGGMMLAWAPLDGLLPGCTTAADVKKVFAGAPETLEMRGGAKVELRKSALALADALVAVEPAFLESWKERAAKLDEARARWEKTVGPKEKELVEFHLKSLGMADPKAELHVYLVSQAPWPGAVTVRDGEGKGVSFVGVDSAAGSQFFEIVLHEATHTLDLASGDASALGELRTLLEKSGRDPRDRALRDLPHALMFVQAAESIRRVLDPAHRDYGESEKVYERLGPSAEVLRGFWRDHLDGKISRAEALASVVASLAPAPR